MLHRRPAKVKTVLHSDHGSQFTTWEFGKELRDADILGSMGSTGTCYDNNLARRHSSFGMPSPIDYQQLHTPSDHDG